MRLYRCSARTSTSDKTARAPCARRDDRASKEDSSSRIGVAQSQRRRSLIVGIACRRLASAPCDLEQRDRDQLAEQSGIGGSSKYPGSSSISDSAVRSSTRSLALSRTSERFIAFRHLSDEAQPCTLCRGVLMHQFLFERLHSVAYAGRHGHRRSLRMSSHARRRGPCGRRFCRTHICGSERRRRYVAESALRQHNQWFDAIMVGCAQKVRVRPRRVWIFVADEQGSDISAQGARRPEDSRRREY